MRALFKLFGIKILCTSHHFLCFHCSHATLFYVVCLQMSGNCSWKEQLKNNFQIQIAKCSSDQDGTCLTVQIPYKVLLKWRDLQGTMENVSYLELFRLSTEHLPFLVELGAEKIEHRVRIKASRVYTESVGKRGHTRNIFLGKVWSFKIFPEEIVNVSNMRKCFEKCKNENIELAREVAERDSRCQQLVEELATMQNLAEKLDVIGQEKNDYLDGLQQNIACVTCSDSLANTGKLVHEVSRRQKGRKVKELKTRAEKALWFLESFGLSLESIHVKDINGNTTCLVNEDRPTGKVSFDNLSETDKDTIRSLLFIMDRCCVSDAAYHEFTMIVDDLPKSYLVKQCRSNVNALFTISRTPGKHPGAQLNFKEELRSEIRKKVIATHC